MPDPLRPLTMTLTLPDLMRNLFLLQYIVCLLSINLYVSLSITLTLIGQPECWPFSNPASNELQCGFPQKVRLERGTALQ